MANATKQNTTQAGATPQVKAWYSNGKSFKTTHYTYAVEHDSFYKNHKQDQLVTAPGLGGRKFKRGFLGIDSKGYRLPNRRNVGVTMQGTGKTSSGEYICYTNSGNSGAKPKFSFGVGGKYAKITRPFEQIAIDPKIIKPRAKVYVESYKRVMSADDVGGAIKGRHIDIFAGPKTYAETCALKNSSSRLGIVDDNTPTTGSTQNANQNANGANQANGSTINFSQTDIERKRAWYAEQNYSDKFIEAFQGVVGTKQDRKVGPKTILKVAEWQKNQNLTPDGCFGQQSANKAGLKIERNSANSNANNAPKPAQQNANNAPNQPANATLGGYSGKAVTHRLGSNTPSWCSQKGLSTSDRLSDLQGNFKNTATSVISAVRSAGAAAKIKVTFRHALRAAMMCCARYHGAAANAKNKLAKHGITVTGNAKDAAAANKAFGVGSNPVALNTNHAIGAAVDVKFSNLNRKTLNINGKSIQLGRAAGDYKSQAHMLNQALQKHISGFKWFGHNDAVHWSVNGH